MVDPDFTAKARDALKSAWGHRICAHLRDGIACQQPAGLRAPCRCEQYAVAVLAAVQEPIATLSHAAGRAEGREDVLSYCERCGEAGQEIARVFRSLASSDPAARRTEPGDGN
jgi:precorrin-2 methylase